MEAIPQLAAHPDFLQVLTHFLLTDIFGSLSTLLVDPLSPNSLFIAHPIIPFQRTFPLGVVWNTPSQYVVV